MAGKHSDQQTLRFQANVETTKLLGVKNLGGSTFLGGQNLLGQSTGRANIVIDKLSRCQANIVTTKLSVVNIFGGTKQFVYQQFLGSNIGSQIFRIK
jgi:hypothetical protein